MYERLEAVLDREAGLSDALDSVRFERDHWKWTARLLAGDLAGFIDVIDPRTTLAEYESRAEKGERGPYGLWEDV